MVLSRLRSDALSVFQAGLEAADPVAAVRRQVGREGDVLTVASVPYSLHDGRGVWLLGMGKASAAMAEPLVELLGDRISGGIINVKYGHRRPLDRVEVREAGHPVPDRAGVLGTERMLGLLAVTPPKDLVICLISGGGSALSPAPAKGLSLQEKRDVTQLLLDSGATIHEMNAVRKHLSRVKGGHLARMAHPASLVALILSDVIGDDLDTIASGPTAPDPSTYTDCLEILRRLDLREEVPPSVLGHLEAGARGEMAETPKNGDPAFETTQNVIVGSNALALEAAREEARRLGYHPLVLSPAMAGDTREAARLHAEAAKRVLATGHPVAPPACIVSGGETTVTVRGSGKGGRNQEFVLAAALEIQSMDRIVVLSAGTDGTDGPTDAAGAMADGMTVARGRAEGMEATDFLGNNDSYHFFHPLKDLLITGPTFTNVMDLRVVMVGREPNLTGSR